MANNSGKTISTKVVGTKEAGKVKVTTVKPATPIKDGSKNSKYQK